MNGRKTEFIDEGVMSGGLVPMAIAGIHVKIIQLREQGQFIGQNLLEAADQKLIDFLEQREPSRAFKRMEVMGRVGAVIQIRAMGLEESAARGRFMKGALETQRDPVWVGKFGANPEGRTSLDELKGWCGETVINRWYGMIYHATKIFHNQLFVKRVRKLFSKKMRKEKRRGGRRGCSLGGALCDLKCELASARARHVAAMTLVASFSDPILPHRSWVPLEMSIFTKYHSIHEA